MSKATKNISNSIIKILKATKTKSPTKPKPKPKSKRPQRRKLATISRQPSSMLSSLSSSAPVAIDCNVEYMSPSQKVGPNGGHLVNNRELILTQLTFGGSTGFNITNFIIVQPGLADTFAWLPPIANDFTTYIIHKLAVVYIPIAPTSTQGDVIVYPAYNPTAPPPTTEIQAANNSDSVTRVVWQGWRKELDCRSMMTQARKYVRSGVVAGDLKTYDACKIWIGSNNAASGNTTGPIGKIFLDYEIEFFEPVVNLNGQLSTPTQTSFYANLTADTIPTGALTSISLSAVYDPFDIGAMLTVNGQTNTLVLPRGWWLVTAAISVADSSAELFSAQLNILQAFNTLSSGQYGVAFARTTGATGGPVLNLTAQAIILVTGATNSNCIQIGVTATGAAGTLTVQKGGTLMFQPA